MEHKGTVKLEAEKIILRRFNKSDAAAMYSILAEDYVK